jgi:hypothetical protein
VAGEDLIVLTVYGAIVVLTALGGIFGPPIVLLVAAALAILWIVILLGYRRDRAVESKR